MSKPRPLHPHDPHALQKALYHAKAVTQVLHELLPRQPAAKPRRRSTDGLADDEPPPAPAAAAAATTSPPLPADANGHSLHPPYLSTDHIEIAGSPQGARVFSINHGPALGLTRSEFLVLATLAVRGLQADGFSPGWPVDGEPGLTGKHILATLEGWTAKQRAFHWPVLDQAVHQAVWKVRPKLASAGAHPELLESLPRNLGGGYRLSTHGSNITLLLSFP